MNGGSSAVAVPRVDILILNWNRWRDTIECLESVMQLEDVSFRIILCDNGSTDDSLDRIKAWANDTTVLSPPEGSPLSPPRRARRDPLRIVDYDRQAAENGGD